MYTREELEAEGLLDFRVFLCHVWAFLGLPRPTKVQLDIAYWLQHGPKRGILQAFRGVGKSWITVAFVLWLLLLDAQINVMVVSANETSATDFTRFCRQLIDGMPILQHLRPHPGQLDSAEAFNVGPAEPDKNPSVKSVGITGQLTGSRADIIIPDDIEIPKNSLTFTMRTRLSDLVKEFDAVLKPLDSSRIIYLGTPQVEETLYVKLQSRGYETAIWPVQIPKNPSAYKGRLGRLIQRMIAEGAQPLDLVEPSRFNAEVCAAILLSYAQSGYNLQMMLDTTLSDVEKHPLKLHNLIVHDCDDTMGHVQLVWGGAKEQTIQDLPAGGFDGDNYQARAWASPEMAKYSTTVMAIDPSGRGKDETGYAVLKYLNGLLYLVDIGGFVDGFGELTLRTLAGKALRWGVNNIIIEENYGGGMFNKLLQPHLIRVFGDKSEEKGGVRKLGSAGRIDDEWNGWSSTQKEMRILDTLEPITQSHRLVVSRRVIEEDLKQQTENERYSFIQQYTRMARIKACLPHEDRLDCLAMACQYFTDIMSRDSSRALKQFQEESLKEELKKFHNNCLVVGAGNSGLVR